jgi:hypothetical protein
VNHHNFAQQVTVPAGNAVWLRLNGVATFGSAPSCMATVAGFTEPLN